MDLQKKDCYLILPKLLYFFISFPFYSIHQFRVPFISQQLNINNSYIGIFIGLAQLFSFIFGLKIASLNDNSENKTFFLSLSIFLSACFFNLLFLSKNVVFFFIIYCFYFSLLSVCLPLLDKLILEYLEKSDYSSEKSYGTQRLFLCFGYICTNFFIEHLISSYDGNKNYYKIVYFSWFFSILFIFLVSILNKKSQKKFNNPSFFKSSTVLLENIDFSFFLLIILLSGITRASMSSFLSMYMQNVLKFNEPSEKGNFIANAFYNSKVSTTSLFANFFEVIIYMNGEYFINKFGYFLPLLISQIFQLFRFFFYYFLDPESKYAFELSCIIEIFKGLNFGFICISGVILAKKLVPINFRSQGQLLYNGSFVALGTVISGVLIYFIFSKKKNSSLLEYRKLFLLNIFLTLVTMVLLFYKYFLKERLFFNLKNEKIKLLKIEKENKTDQP